MIISLRHNYIYIRTKKTGSSTIEALLQQHLSDADIVVRNNLEIIGPVLKPGIEIPAISGAVTHVAISKIMPLLREDFWNGAYKFTSERHPYEKAVSLAYWRLERMAMSDNPSKRIKGSATNFQEYLDKVVRAGKYSSFRYYAIDGKPVVDDFVKLESLERDIRRIAQRINLQVPDELPRKRAFSRIDRRPAREILSDEQKEIVWGHCRNEFEIHGYER